MRLKILLILMLVCVSFGLRAQNYTANGNAHSHNDYLHAQPFLEAYHNRFGSVEIDIFLVDGKLYVAHTRAEIAAPRTIEALYLDPLLEKIEENGGKVYPDGGKLQLLIDLKTSGETLRTLEKQLQPIRRWFDTANNPDAVRLVISGGGPAPSDFDDYDTIFFFDGRPGIQYTPEQERRVAFYSAPLAAFSRWNGLGRIPEAEYLKIKELVDSIHTKGKKLRFWGNPDTKTCWQALIKLGVDYINTDNIAGLADFLNDYPKNFHPAGREAYVPYRPSYRTDGGVESPKNVILLISDGAGLSQIWAAATANRGALNVMNCRTMGYLQTNPSDDYNTDSAAAGTAIATGGKTRNRHIGVDHSGAPAENIVERLAAAGMACGIVSNDGLAGATPSAFYAHQQERNMTEAILSDLLRSPASLVIAGGGRQRNGELIDRLEEVGVGVCESIGELKTMPQRDGERIVCLDADRPGDGYRVIEMAFDESIRRLSGDPDGFFLMVEGAKIDSGGHDNDIDRCVDEYLSFDRMVGRALEFADRNGETLLIVTSDHETGGLVLIDGDYATGSVLGHFATNDHTGAPVPIFAYGPSSGKFSGFIQNSDIKDKIIESLAD